MEGCGEADIRCPLAGDKPRFAHKGTEAEVFEIEDLWVVAPCSKIKVKVKLSQCLTVKPRRRI
jgi:hypothetical protein